jgi:hypothetical protein
VCSDVELILNLQQQLCDCFTKLADRLEERLSDPVTAALWRWACLPWWRRWWELSELGRGANL